MVRIRAEVLVKIRQAYRDGVSMTRFIKDMRAKGLGYPRTKMQADWRTVTDIAEKEGALQLVRRNALPPKTRIAQVTWELSKEYLYKVRTESRLRPDEPIVERFVNIMSDKPLTPEELEAQVEERWGEWEKYQPEELVSLQAWTAFRRVAE